MACASLALAAEPPPKQDPPRKPDTPENADPEKPPLKPGEVRSYECPDDAFSAYTAAAKANDAAELAAVIGPGWAQAMQEAGVLGQNFGYGWNIRSQVFLLNWQGQLQVKFEENKTRARVGLGGNTLPMPVVKKGKNWCFDQDPKVLAEYLPVLRRKCCEAHLQELGGQLHQFGSSFSEGGRLPRKLDELKWARPECLLCAAVGEKEHGPGVGRFEHCDFMYIPGLRFDPTARGSGGAGGNGPILAFDRKKNHGNGRNVLRVNGNVEWMGDEKKFREAVTQTLQGAGLSLEMESKHEQPALTEAAAKPLREALAKLGSEEYGARETAAQTLQTAGEKARLILQEGRRSLDPEVQERCAALLKELDFRLSNQPWVAEMRWELGLDEKPPAPSAPEKPAPDKR